MQSDSILIVGLGNPGDKYLRTRHNAGFLSIDILQKEEILKTSDWKKSKNFKAFLSEGKYKDTKIYLLKPQTFMNLSGQSVALIAGFYKINPKNIFVVYDDKDLSIGKLRIRDMGSSGGHNGIRSISENLGTLNFIRFRIGIATENLEKMDTSNYVLGKLSKEDEKIIIEITHKKIIPAIFRTIDEDLKAAQNSFGS